MPELPEVETLCRQLQEKVVERRIRSTAVYDDKLDGMEDLRKCVITRVQRRGKTILMVLDDGRSIAIHLRMTGRLLLRSNEQCEPHTRWRIRFIDGVLDLVDPRRFATVRVEPTREDIDRNDLITGFDTKAFLARQAIRKVSVKSLLMDPKAVSGIGNIYACEILHHAGISPLRLSMVIRPEEWKKIFRQAQRILKKGIENRGTSISDWRDLYGCKGENQKELRVYRREGKQCLACKKVIVRIKQGGRSSFYCPQCQK